MTDAEFRRYFREQQVSLQWLPVLRALAAELESRESPEVLRSLFSAMGQRLASEAGAQLGDPDTLAELQQSLNDFWSQMNWGWVTLTEQAGSLEILHHAAPLAEAFGDEALVWSCGFLEGFYQATCQGLGAQASLSVQWVDMADEGSTLVFELSH